MTMFKKTVQLLDLPNLATTLRKTGAQLQPIVVRIWQIGTTLNLVKDPPIGLPVPSSVTRARTEAYLRLLQRRPDIAQSTGVPAVFVETVLTLDKGLSQTQQGLLIIAQRADDGMRLVAAGLSAVISDVWTGLSQVTSDPSLPQTRRDYINGLWSDVRDLMAKPGATQKARAKKKSAAVAGLKAQIQKNAKQRQIIADRAALIAEANKK